MTCEVCNSKPATIVVKKIINGTETQMRLCEDCAKKKLAGVTSMFNFSDLFGSFKPLDHHIGNVAKEREEELTKACPSCGMTLRNLKDTGKVGCGKCYDTFREYMEPFIKGIHGKTVHTGKIAPVLSDGENEEDIMTPGREISIIRRKLEDAVKEENYELAAEYRDLIHSLTSKEAENDG